ncbi:hypothetical protein CCP4SC76_190011 [Gammaproteobacteria bacterium]
MRERGLGGEGSKRLPILKDVRFSGLSGLWFFGGSGFPGRCLGYRIEPRWGYMTRLRYARPQNPI